jgi:hypothetical protein
VVIDNPKNRDDDWAAPDRLRTILRQLIEHASPRDHR